MRPGGRYASVRMKDGREATLRALRKEDLPSLVKFVNGLVAEKRHHADLGVVIDQKATRASESEYLEKVLTGIRKGDVISVAAEVDGEVAGNSEITRRSSSRETWHVGVLGIAVLHPYRSAGLGEAMMQTLLKEAKRAGIELIELEVFALNDKARRLYERHGFKEVGVVPGKIRRGRRRLDIVVMYANLRTAN